MKTLFILLIAVVIGYGQTDSLPNSHTFRLDGKSYWRTIPIDTIQRLYVYHRPESRADTATTYVIYDSLGFLKYDKVFRIGFWQDRIRLEARHLYMGLEGGAKMSMHRYDSTIYIRDGKIFKFKVLMEFNMGGGK